MKNIMFVLSIMAIAVAGVASAQSPFSDVSSSDSHATAIEYVFSEGIVNGYDDGTYQSLKEVNRAELTKIMANSALTQAEIETCNVNLLPYSDTGTGSWYAPYVCALTFAEMVEGYSDQTYRPANTINVAEAAKIIVEAFGYEVSPTSVWYEGYISALLERNAISLDITAPDSNLTRGQMAEIIYRLKSGVSINLDDVNTGILATGTPRKADVTKLPLGDNMVSSSATKGYIYSCQTSFNGGGAFTAGPWIDEAAGTWDLTQKAQVDGEVEWPNYQFSISTSGDTRTVVGNSLPNHTTGTYPIDSEDDAYQYDRNPNSISAQQLSFTLPVTPTLLTAPECVGGEVGIMLSGVPIYNGFDAGGRDAVAMEVQDSCAGHPQQTGQYHYHGPSDCLSDDSVDTAHSALQGYAFDGFGIYGLKGEGGHELTSDDLDECHGHTHNVAWDNTTTLEMYHYHLTNDFPYSVGCFRGAKQVDGSLSSGAGTIQDNNPPSGGQVEPPQEAIDACIGKDDNASCSFGPVPNGTCRTTPDGIFACVPG